ncbi:MAG: hypothetical protein R6W48_08780 [Gaiellaceae bacterium]
MDRALGILLLVAYILAIVGLAALITWAVIKIFPTVRTPKNPEGNGTHEGPSNGGKASDGSVGGRLYRRAKRGTA